MFIKLFISSFSLLFSSYCQFANFYVSFFSEEKYLEHYLELYILSNNAFIAKTSSFFWLIKKKKKIAGHFFFKLTCYEPYNVNDKIIATKKIICSY